MWALLNKLNKNRKQSLDEIMQEDKIAIRDDIADLYSSLVAVDGDLKVAIKDVEDKVDIVDIITDNINTRTIAMNTNINNIVKYTGTDNRSNATGTLSQKMSYIIDNMGGVSLRGTGVTVYSKTLNLAATTKLRTDVVAKFIAPKAGLYRITYSSTGTSKSSLQKLSAFSYSSGLRVGTDLGQVWYTSSVGSIDTSGNKEKPIVTYTGTVSNQYSYIYCEAGEPVILTIDTLLGSAAFKVTIKIEHS